MNDNKLLAITVVTIVFMLCASALISTYIKEDSKMRLRGYVKIEGYVKEGIAKEIKWSVMKPGGIAYQQKNKTN